MYCVRYLSLAKYVNSFCLHFAYFSVVHGFLTVVPGKEIY